VQLSEAGKVKKDIKVRSSLSQQRTSNNDSKTDNSQQLIGHLRKLHGLFAKFASQHR
jgi:hypothetical protein